MNFPEVPWSKKLTSLERSGSSSYFFGLANGELLSQPNIDPLPTIRSPPKVNANPSHHDKVRSDEDTLIFPHFPFLFFFFLSLLARAELFGY